MTNVVYLFIYICLILHNLLSSTSVMFQLTYQFPPLYYLLLYPEYYFLYLINLNIASPYKFIGKINMCIYVYIHICAIHTYILLCDVMCIYKICDVYILYIHDILLYNIYTSIYKC